MMTTATKEPANGTVIQELPANPDQRLTAFQVEVAALMEKYGVKIVPYVMTFNDGSQVAGVNFVVVK